VNFTLIETPEFAAQRARLLADSVYRELQIRLLDTKRFASLKRSLEQAVRIERANLAPARVVTVADLDPPDVGALRQRLGLSQELFAAGIGVPVGTLRNWEQGVRTPKGPARILLHLVEQNPRVVFNTVNAVRERAPEYRVTRTAADTNRARK
jgi:putative transcriptional regulator